MSVLLVSFRFPSFSRRGSLEGTEYERIINNFKLSFKEEEKNKIKNKKRRRKNFRCETGMREGLVFGLVFGLALPSHEVYKCSLQRVNTMKEHSF